MITTSFLAGLCYTNDDLTHFRKAAAASDPSYARKIGTTCLKLDPISLYDFPQVLSLIVLLSLVF